MASIRSLIFKDLRIKALALVMALAVYVHVFSAQDREMIFSVPIAIAPLSGGFVLANVPPKEAQVRVHGSGKDLLKLRTRGFKADVRLDSPRSGSLQRPLLISDFQLPRGVKAHSIEVMSPTVLDLQIEHAATVDLPVAPRMGGAVPPDRALVRRPTPFPLAVRVTGPRSVIATLDSVRTVPVTAEGLRGDFEQEAEIDLPPNFVVEPRRVRVRFELEERLDRRTALLPVEVSLPRWTQLISVDPDSGSVVISGAVSVIGQVQLDETKLVATISHRTPRIQTVPLRAVVDGLPPHFPARIVCEPESVQVIFR
jgi:YbbR domain-containing protein